ATEFKICPNLEPSSKNPVYH
ncbi:unnamed protein product, partial [Allacma fusca]